ncbi:DNA-binding protein [Rathayibacter soli]|uniref:DNA-binding protein n=1 Tax=Rathayibacter soli TaxID=3144168 RepID=UPI0027E48D01|nr:DNA-binding protein [Glaciibacter superstes]
MAEGAMTAAEEKAARAAEELATEGLAVSAAAVRERSGVRMATAAAAAKAWKERANQASDQVDAPMPESLQARFQTVAQATWREARTQSRAEFDEARSGWETKVAAAEADVVRLTAAVEDLEAERERAAEAAAGRIAELEASVEKATAAVTAAEERAMNAEGIAAGLREALTTLKPAVD